MSENTRLLTLVTGGGRGIGAATALDLARRGHDVVLGYRQDHGSADNVAEQVRAVGRACWTMQADCSREADVDRLFDTVAAEAGQLTGLVNNAGLTAHIGALADTPVAVIRRVVEVNLLGVVLCARRAVQAMAIDRGGSGGAIVNVSSVAAATGSPHEYVHYAAAKAGVEAFTTGLAKEVAASGIRVNAVAPGVIDTEIHAAAGDPGRAARIAPRIPMERAGQAVEIAAAIGWLMSPEASYATGATLRVTGGL